MPTFEVPKNKDEIRAQSIDHYRQVTLPASPEIMRALKIGEDASFFLTGKVISMTDSVREHEARGVITVEAAIVAVDDEISSKKAIRQAMQKGYEGREYE